MKYDLDNVLKEEDISCPNFFKIKNKWVLLCISHTHGCRYYIGKWNKKSEIFIPEKHVRMNWPNSQDSKYQLENRDFFAPESVKTLDGRRVMWSWMRMQNIKNLNILSIPRELDINKKNQLTIKPATELQKLRGNKKILKNTEIKTSSNKFNSVIKKNILLVKSQSFELKIRINIKKIKNKSFGFELFASKKKEGFSIIFQPENKTILVGNTEAPFNLEDIKDENFLEINIFVDKFLIEVFVNNFQSVVGTYLNYRTNNTISAYCLGDTLIIDSITLWKLKQANTGYKEAKKNKIWKVNEKLRIN
jgi:sucrose-6-phosphate hydrolase SacC (GH32 family)